MDRESLVDDEESREYDTGCLRFEEANRGSAADQELASTSTSSSVVTIESRSSNPHGKSSVCTSRTSHVNNSAKSSCSSSSSDISIDKSTTMSKKEELIEGCGDNARQIAAKVIVSTSSTPNGIHHTENNQTLLAAEDAEAAAKAVHQTKEFMPPDGGCQVRRSHQLLLRDSTY